MHPAVLLSLASIVLLVADPLLTITTLLGCFVVLKSMSRII